ncbi:MAG TPA: hypothetical protein VFB22_17775 [Candidatus Baltobacteraceae bacterium]|nr:hypothetical protein [Candidatus Baltobacteraceae bacterium]
MYDPQDERGVPISTGVPSVVIYAGVGGLVLIVLVAALVLSQSQFGHIWPASDAVNLKL